MQLSKNCRSFNATGKFFSFRENWRAEPKLVRASYARLRALRYGAAAFASPLRCERRLVGAGGFEPPTLRLSSACSNQLSYAPTLVEPTRIELVTSCLQSRRSPS